MQERDNKTEVKEQEMEQSISSIGAKIADANDISSEITELSEKSEDKLKEAQEELSDLYMEMEE